MAKGISNIQIENALRNLDDEDINDEYKTMISENEENILLLLEILIALTRTVLTGGSSWTLSHEQTYFFNLFGLNRLKSFIILYHQKEIEKIPFGIQKLTRVDNKTALVNIKYSLNAWKNLSENNLDNLRDTATGIFYFAQYFRDNLKLCDFVNLWVVKDRIEKVDSARCDIFERYFYDNLFNHPQKQQYTKRSLTKQKDNINLI